MRLNIKGIPYYQADGSLIPVYVTANDPNLTLNEIPRSFRTGNPSERLRNKPPPELHSTMEVLRLCNDSPGNQEGDRFPGEVILVNVQASCTFFSSLLDAASMGSLSVYGLRGVFGRLVGKARRLPSDNAAQQEGVETQRGQVRCCVLMIRYCSTK